MFRDKANTPAMIKHGIDVLSEITNHVNPGQVPVMTVDQPLFAIAKKIQWKWPDTYGEKHLVVLLGGLHIEMNVLSLMGTFLEGSDRSHVLTRAEVMTEGRVAGVIKGSNTSTGQWAHQVSVVSLYILMRRSYSEYKSVTPNEEQLCFEDWCIHMSESHSPI